MENTELLTSRIFGLSNIKGISDIHLKPGFSPITRVQGKLNDSGIGILSSEDIDGVISTLFSEYNYRSFKNAHQADAAVTYNGRRYRLNAYMDMNGCNLAIRCLNSVITNDMGVELPPVMFSAAEQKSGLILITGPTGSGKTTSMATLIQHINMTSSLHIITIEDPIEYIFKPEKCIITQREVGENTSSFASALHAALREDPDVIVLGEMRDIESIQGAIQAAETGHLVFATLHTRGAVNSIDRIIDVFPAEKQSLLRVELSMVITAVMSQQLIPAADGNGRVLATEIMLGTDAIKNLIRTGKTQLITSSIQSSRKIGMHTMDTCLEELYRAKKITADDRRTYSYGAYDMM